MKHSIKSSLVALAMTAMVTTMIAGPASANVPKQSIAGAVNSAVSTGNVSIKIENGTATLFGWVEDAQTEQAALSAALRFDNVDRVVDLMTVSH